MKKILLVCFALAFSALISACGDATEPVAEKEHKKHVWTSQTDALKEAQNTADDISAALQQREQLSRPSD